MNYACLVYVEESAFMPLSKEDGAKLTDDSIEYDQDLKRQGHLIVAQALKAPDSAITIRVRNGKASSTDGPFAETKEHLAGFILVEARDLNEAIRIATGIPMARLGSIEVRPIMELEHT